MAEHEDNNERTLKGGMFDGDQSKYANWKNGCMLKVAQKGLSGRAAATYLIDRLEGDAIATVLAGRVSGDTVVPFETAADVIRALDSSYAGTQSVNKEAAMRALTRVRQGKRTADEFMAEFEAYANAAGIDEKQRIGMMKASVSSRILPIVLGVQDMGYADFKILVRTADAALPREKKDPPAKNRNKARGGEVKEKDASNIKCFACNKMGHYRKDCRSKEKGRAAKETDDDPEVESENLYGDA